MLELDSFDCALYIEHNGTNFVVISQILVALGEFLVNNIFMAFSESQNSLVIRTFSYSAQMTTFMTGIFITRLPWHRMHILHPSVKHFVLEQGKLVTG